MKLVIVESPFRGNENYHQHEHERYARLALRDCLEHGESPFASHLLYTQPEVLDDQDIQQRAQGMRSGWDWMQVANRVVVYTDLGISSGMEDGIRMAEKFSLPIEHRQLPDHLKQLFTQRMDHQPPPHE